MESYLVNAFVKCLDDTFARNERAPILEALDLSLRLDKGSVENSVHTANLVIGQHADHIVITAIFLIPLRQKDRLTKRNIADRFGELPADLVESAHTQALMRTDTEEHHKTDLSTRLESFTHDIRSAVLQVGTRLSALERGLTGDRDMVPLAKETMDLYVPLAGRLGMGGMRSRLEDVCFRILEPNIYKKLHRAYAPIRKEDEACLKLLTEGMQKLFNRNYIKAAVRGRIKGLFSLYRKMQRDDLPIDAVTDKIGTRIIVTSVPECYSALGFLHTHFQPIPGRFKDYIGLPKDNGYQSLHTCIYPIREISHKPVEIQIRTEAMHWEAEFGVAAHWYYKSREDNVTENKRQLKWLQSLSAEHEKSANHTGFMDRLRSLVYDNNIIVFSPSGEKIRLPYGSTARTFASGLGYDLSNQTTVRINGKSCALDTVLKDGDTVDLNPQKSLK